jgi:hypothetical protein
MKDRDLIQLERLCEALAKKWDEIYLQQLQFDPVAAAFWPRYGDPRHDARELAKKARAVLKSRGITPPPPGAPSPSRAAASSNVIAFTDWRRKAG